MGKQPSSSKEAVVSTNYNTSSKTKLADCPEKGNEDYDPFEQRDFNGLGTTGALFHMIKGSLGTGILAMPMAFKNGGLWVGLIGAFLIGYLCTHCVALLVHCSQVLSKRMRKPCLGFAETTEAAFFTGPTRVQKYATPAREIVNISLLISYYLGDTVYIVFIATAFKKVGDQYLDADFNIRLYILSLAVILVPIGCIRQLKYLVPFSASAIAFLMFSCAVVLFNVISELPPLDSRPAFSSWKDLPLFYATMCFAIEGIGTVLPIENAMKTPRHFLHYPWVLNIAMTWLVLTYSTMGFFGYLRYGADTQGSITLNLGHSAMSEVINVLVALNAVFSYPLLFCVVSESVWKYVDDYVSKENKTRYYYIMRVSMILGTVLLATALPNLEPIIGLVGTICYSTLGLLFPSILELVTFWGDVEYMGRYRWRYGKNFILIVAWLIALIAGLEASIAKVIEIYWP